MSRNALRNCAWCGAEAKYWRTASTRKDARYHSNACRQSAWRFRERVRKDVAELLRVDDPRGVQLLPVLGWPPDDPRWRALHHLARNAE